jgi:hypothetical protein
MMGFEDHHLPNNSQWVPILGSQIQQEREYLHRLNIFPHTIFINCKKKNSFTMEGNGRPHLN